MRRAITSFGLIVLTLLFLQACAVTRPAPKRLYPDGPDLPEAEAAVINILDWKWEDGGSWSRLNIVPLSAGAEFGAQKMPSTWVLSLPPGDYEFQLPHPYEKVRWTQVREGMEIETSFAATIVIRAELEAGKYYRLIYSNNPGVNDFEIWELSEKGARKFSGYGPELEKGRIISRPATPEVLQPFFGTQQFRGRRVD